MSKDKITFSKIHNLTQKIWEDFYSVERSPKCFIDRETASRIKNSFAPFYEKSFKDFVSVGDNERIGQINGVEFIVHDL